MAVVYDINSASRDRRQYPKVGHFRLDLTNCREDACNEPMSLAAPYDHGQVMPGSTTNVLILPEVKAMPVPNFHARRFVYFYTVAGTAPVIGRIIASHQNQLTFEPPLPADPVIGETWYVLRQAHPAASGRVGNESTDTRLCLQGGPVCRDKSNQCRWFLHVFPLFPGNNNRGVGEVRHITHIAPDDNCVQVDKAFTLNPETDPLPWSYFAWEQWRITGTVDGGNATSASTVLGIIRRTTTQAAPCSVYLREIIVPVSAPIVSGWNGFINSYPFLRVELRPNDKGMDGAFVTANNNDKIGRTTYKIAVDAPAFGARMFHQMRDGSPSFSDQRAWTSVEVTILLPNGDVLDFAPFAAFVDAFPQAGPDPFSQVSLTFVVG